MLSRTEMNCGGDLSAFYFRLKLELSRFFPSVQFNGSITIIGLSFPISELLRVLGNLVQKFLGEVKRENSFQLSGLSVGFLCVLKPHTINAAH